MKTNFRLGAGLSVALLALAACSGGDDGAAAPPPPAAALEDQFGTGFATAFRAAPNTDPVDAGAGTVVPVSLTTDPVPVP